MLLFQLLLQVVNLKLHGLSHALLLGFLILQFQLHFANGVLIILLHHVDVVLLAPGILLKDPLLSL